MGELAAGQRCEVLIDDLGREGQGIGRSGDAVVFVPGALPGERAEVLLVRRARRHWWSQLERILEPSPARRTPPCILAERCGGCTLQHLDPQAQAAWKHDAVRQALQRIAALEAEVQPVVQADSALAYRNRAIIPLERAADGRVRCGYYRRGSHRIVNLSRCPVLDPRIDALVSPIKADLEATDWPIDRDCHAAGGLRHLALRVGVRTGEVLITLISSHERLAGLEALAQAWMDRWPEVVGVTLNVQPRPDNRLMGPDTRVLAGRASLRERFAGLELSIATDTFFQVCTAQAERVVPLLLQALATMARPASSHHPGTVIDAYCGIGTYSLPIAAAGWQVEGLELNPGAVALARRNATANGLEGRCRFRAADVGTALAERLPGAEALVLDPPRRGLDPAVLAQILAHPPPLLVYLSCDPATLARDLQQLVDSGAFALVSVQPLDFFPHTTHVEVLSVLRRREGNAAA